MSNLRATKDSTIYCEKCGMERTEFLPSEARRWMGTYHGRPRGKRKGCDGELEYRSNEVEKTDEELWKRAYRATRAAEIHVHAAWVAVDGALHGLGTHPLFVKMALAELNASGAAAKVEEAGMLVLGDDACFRRVDEWFSGIAARRAQLAEINDELVGRRRRVVGLTEFYVDFRDSEIADRAHRQLVGHEEQIVMLESRRTAILEEIKVSALEEYAEESK